MTHYVQRTDLKDPAAWVAQNRARLEKRTKSREGISIPQAALDARYLTNDAAFDRFLQHLQAQLEGETAELETARSVLLDPDVLDDSELRRAKLDYSRRSERVEILRQVISVPAELAKLDAGEPDTD